MKFTTLQLIFQRPKVLKWSSIILLLFIFSNTSTILASTSGPGSNIDGGVLSGGPFAFTINDGIADNITPGDITLTGNTGTNSQWIVTDYQRNILGLPPMPSVPNFDGAGQGTCLVWHLSYEDGIEGLEMGLNANDLSGCFSLSNAIPVLRTDVNCTLDGGTLEGGPFAYCVGDGIPDNIDAGAIALTGNSGPNARWVVTDDQGNILGLPPMPSVVNFDGAGAGTCLIWNITYEDGLEGLAMGENVAALIGCYNFSNAIAVVRSQPEGGTLEGGPFAFTVNDGIADNITPGDITLTGNTGSNSQWIVTDYQRNILGLPPMPSVPNFDGAGQGTCLVWHLSYEDGIDGLEMGLNANDLSGCFSLSNAIPVLRTDVNCTADGGTLEGGPYAFCVGDGIPDNIAAGDITLNGNSGPNNRWVVTDDQGNILGLPPMPSVVNFDGAGAGTCLIWNIAYEDGLEGLAMGENVAALIGCYNFSNSIAVVRSQPVGGTLEGGPYAFCVGDGIPDNIAAGDITLNGNSGPNNRWVVTDDQGNILGLPPMPSVVNFDGAGAGTCLIWNIAYEDGLQGLAMGENVAGLTGCYNFSNSIAVVRTQLEGGTLEGGPYAFCVGDGIPDNIAAGDITLNGNSGPNNRWVVTDDQGNILGLPPMPSVVNFDGAGAGTCLIWNIAYEDGLQGLAMGENVSGLTGCYNFSNSIAVVRSQPQGGTLGALTGNIYNRAVIANRASGTISVINSDNNEVEGTYDMPDNGEPMYVVYNDLNNSVLVGDYNGKVAAFDGKTFDHLGSADAGRGVFHMWLSPNNQQLWVNNELDKTISVINPNDLTTITTINIPADLANDYKPHDVILMPNNAAAFVTYLGANTGNDYVVKYSTTTFEETARAAVGADPHVSLTSANDKLYVASQGTSELKVFNRSDLSEVTSISIPNAHGLGMNNAGTFLYVGNISNGGTDATYTVDLSNNSLVGDPVDAPFAAPHNYAVTTDDSKLFLTHSGATNNQVSIYALSPTPSLISSLTVGSNPFGLVAYTYVETKTEMTICAGDNVSDAFDVSLNGASGSNSAWVITDTDLNILALPPAPPFDLDGAGAGTCLIWHLSYEDGLVGAEVGQNAGDLQGCYNLSNAITVVRNQPEGGTLDGGPFAFCVGDGIPDNIDAGAITLNGNSGPNNRWVITDDQGNILGLPPMPSVVNFDGAGAGTCLIWNIAYEDGLEGLEMGENVSGLIGCYNFSNSIAVVRTQPEGGMLEGGPFAFTVNDGIADNIPAGAISLNGNTGGNSQWIITDDQGNILGLPPMPSVVNFEGAGAGTCLIWHLSYEDGLQGLEAGLNTADFSGCYSLSNALEVLRTEIGGSGIDLNLDIEVASSTYGKYERVPYTITITNEGNETATGVVVSAGLPNGMVHSDDEVSQGEYSLYHEEWRVGTLEPGQSETLELTLFTKVEGVDIINYVQVIEADQNDVDSTPDNNDGPVPMEDDEAAVTISEFGGTGPGSIDLELAIEADSDVYIKYENVIYTITVTNNGTDPATDITIHAGLPDGMVHTEDDVSEGDYNLYFETWSLDYLAPGQSETLELELFTKVEDVSILNFVEVISVNENDVDSSPGNGNGTTPQEDDEAAITIEFDDSQSLVIDAPKINTNSQLEALGNLYPNPASAQINIDFDLKADTELEIQILDISGRLFKTIPASLDRGFHQLTLDISDLAPGSYLLRTVGQMNSPLAKRFVKID